MIGHTFAKLYVMILNMCVSDHFERNRIKVVGKARFQNCYQALNHILTPNAIIEDAKQHSLEVSCCFVDFQKVFYSVLWASLSQRLQDIDWSP